MSYNDNRVEVVRRKKEKKSKTKVIPMTTPVPSKFVSNPMEVVSDTPKNLMNAVVFDLSNIGQNPNTQQMYRQVYNLHQNYSTDIGYFDSVHSILQDLDNNLIKQVERDTNLKERKQAIQEYYKTEYDQQIFIVKYLIFFTLIALVGCFLFQYQLISSSLLMIYLGMVGSVAFVVIFYYLWDFYLRDNTLFDEYNFSTYVPTPQTEQDEKSRFSDISFNC